MACPFPGMDPYVERPDLWPDFHNRLMTAITEALQPLLKPRYVAKTEDRLYVQETERTVIPDVGVFGRFPRGEHGGGVATLAAADEAVVMDFDEVEVRETLLHILDSVSGRLVTALEVLSPDNKFPGRGRERYLASRSELLEAGVNLVEIDLLREGPRTFGVPERLRPKLEARAGGAWRYLISTLRARPHRQELYPFRLQASLPRLAIPLDFGTPDVPLDLPRAFARVWDSGPYPELLQYSGPPPGQLPEDALAWCRERLAAAE